MNREEIIKRFDDKFDVGYYNWGQYFVWAVNNDPSPEEIKSFFLDEILPEVLRKLQFDSYDIQTIWEHYWGWDYSPSYIELKWVAESMNNRFIAKAIRKYNIKL